MRTIEPEKIPLEKIDKLLNFWKDFQRIQEKIPRNLKGFSLLSSWIKGCAELHIKQSLIDVLNKEMSFQTDLDKYLTTPPNDNSNYFEAVYDMIPLEVLPQVMYDSHEETLDKIVDECCINGIDPATCANFMMIMLKLNLIKGID